MFAVPRASVPLARAWSLAPRRALATTTESLASSTSAPPAPPRSEAEAASTPESGVAAGSGAEPLTHYKITLRRSAISLQEKIKGTVTALGLRRRHQTVYQAHTPEAAGMILRIKELVEVENVPASAVRTQGEQRKERKAPRGFTVEKSALGPTY
jgi:large subunit ribosomal protein L30